MSQPQSHFVTINDLCLHYLTDDIGHPALQRYLNGVLVLMKSVMDSNPNRA